VSNVFSNSEHRSYVR